MTTSLGKLQILVDNLTKKNLKLTDRIAELVKLVKSLKNKIKKMEKDQEEKIVKAVDESIKEYESELIEENKALRERVFKLEQMMNISSKTSSLPPSQDPIWKKDTTVYDSRSQKNEAETEKKNIGGQLGHPKRTLPKFSDDEITESKNYELSTCTNCESSNLTLIDIESHDETDFKVIVTKTRHNFYKYLCNDCGKVIMTDVPKNLCADNQYGPDVQALALSLIDFGDVSFKRTRDIIKGLTNGEINPCEGYLAKLPKRASKKLKKFIFEAEEEIVKSPVVQHDDGTVKIGKTDDDIKEELEDLVEKKKKDGDNELTAEEITKLNDQIKKNFKGVIRAYTNGKLKVYKTHTDKSADTYKDDDILTRLKETTVVVHDHMKYNYNDLFKFQNAECNIHPIRKGRGVKANTNHEWPDKMADLLESYNERRNKLIDKQIDHFSQSDLACLSARYDDIVSSGIIECNSFKHKNIYTDERNLLEFFKEYKKEILLWSTNFSIPFTNNVNFLIMLTKKARNVVKSSLFFNLCFSKS